MAATGSRPLVVDLDGTLVKSDTLVDSLLVMARTRPLRFLGLPRRLLHGKAAFKAYVAQQVALDVAHLPYNRQLLAFLTEERARGRALYLATGADGRLAGRVAEHLGIFTGVLASDGLINLTGNHKLAALRSRLGVGDFDYVGNETADLPLLERAGLAVAVGDATFEVKRASHYITTVPGGRGAAREVVELILKSQGKWKKAVPKAIA